MRGSLGWVSIAAHHRGTEGRSSLGTYARLREASTRVAMSGGWSLDSRYANALSQFDFARRSQGPMSFWRRMLGKESRETLQPQRLDYLNEGLALERQGDFEAALTSYRLAFRDNPSDSRILLNMAIAFTKTSQPEEAIRHYKRALELDPGLVGAHYGVAFLLLKRGDVQQASEHLRAFLARPPKGPDAERWVRHAETALREIAGSPAPETR